MINFRAKFRLFLLAFCLALSSLMCSLPGSGTPATATADPILATLQALQITQTAIAALASPTVEEPPVPSATLPATEAAPTPGPSLGSISGQLGYPSEFIPPLRIVAFHLDSGQFFYLDTILNQTFYQITDLPAGTYHVVAYMKENNAMAGGYTLAVPCGLDVSCTDHSLVAVSVLPGQDTGGVDLRDWYAPPGTFPPNPAP